MHLTDILVKNGFKPSRQKVDGMYDHGNTIFIPTEAGVPILQTTKK